MTRQKYQILVTIEAHSTKDAALFAEILQRVGVELHEVTLTRAELVSETGLSDAELDELHRQLAIAEAKRRGLTPKDEHNGVLDEQMPDIVKSVRREMFRHGVAYGIGTGAWYQDKEWQRKRNGFEPGGIAQEDGTTEPKPSCGCSLNDEGRGHFSACPEAEEGGA